MGLNWLVAIMPPSLAGMYTKKTGSGHLLSPSSLAPLIFTTPNPLKPLPPPLPTPPRSMS